MYTTDEAMQGLQGWELCRKQPENNYDLYEYLTFAKFAHWIWVLF